MTTIVPNACGEDAVRPRLLDGAAFWVGNPLAAKKKETASATAIAFAPDGERLVIGESNGLVSVVAVSFRSKVSGTKGHDSEIVSILFRPAKAAYFTPYGNVGVRR